MVIINITDFSLCYFIELLFHIGPHCGFDQLGINLYQLIKKGVVINNLLYIPSDNRVLVQYLIALEPSVVLYQHVHNYECLYSLYVLVY